MASNLVESCVLRICLIEKMVMLIRKNITIKGKLLLNVLIARQSSAFDNIKKNDNQSTRSLIFFELLFTLLLMQEFSNLIR